MDIEHILSGINDHAPAGRKTIAEHMDSGDLTYRTRSGHVCELTADEMKLLWDACTEQEKLALRIPVMVMTDTSFEQSTWKVEGKAEASVISKILNKRQARDGLLYMYHPHLRELTKKLPNAVITVFVP